VFDGAGTDRVSRDIDANTRTTALPVPKKVIAAERAMGQRRGAGHVVDSFHVVDAFVANHG